MNLEQNDNGQNLTSSPSEPKPEPYPRKPNRFLGGFFQTTTPLNAIGDPLKSRKEHVEGS